MYSMVGFGLGDVRLSHGRELGLVWDWMVD